MTEKQGTNYPLSINPTPPKIDSIPIAFDSNHEMENLVGEIKFDTGMSARARMIYNILKKHPNMVEFCTEYIMHEDGKVELVGISTHIKPPKREVSDEELKAYEDLADHAF